jgi:hypothetical protein
LRSRGILLVLCTADQEGSVFRTIWRKGSRNQSIQLNESCLSQVDFLLHGSKATQGFAADTFSLGLAVLHLFTGNAPYEEILCDVRCPEGLYRLLQEVWASDPDYDVIRRVIHVDGKEVDRALHDTLYRYLVLFGLPSDKDSNGPVCAAIERCIRVDDDPPRAGGAKVYLICHL